MIAVYDKQSERVIDEAGRTVRSKSVETYVASMDGNAKSNHRQVLRWIERGDLPLTVHVPSQGPSFFDHEIVSMLRRYPGRVPDPIARFFIDEQGGIRNHPKIEPIELDKKDT